MKLKSLGLFIVLATIVILDQRVFAQSNPKWPISLPKGTTVTLKIPNAGISLEKVSIWSGRYSFTVPVEHNGYEYTVDGNSDWKGLGWPSQLVLYVNKVERKKEYTQVELDDVNGNHIKLRFGASVSNINAALLTLVYPGSLSEFQSSEYYQKEVADRFLPGVFAGPLGAIPREMQLQMIKAANYDLKAIGSETYKGRYFMIFRGVGSDVYNTIQLNQPARVARAIEKDVLSSMRLAYKGLAEVVGVDGFKVELKVGHKNFVSEQYLNPYYDDLHIYATKDVIKRFAEDDITSQQFVNECIVLVNGNRVDVSLTQFK